MLALGRLWLKVPPTIQIRVHGRFGRGVTAKDLILRILGRGQDDRCDLQGGRVHRPDDRGTLNARAVHDLQHDDRDGREGRDGRPRRRRRSTTSARSPSTRCTRCARTPTRGTSGSIDIDVTDMPPMVACPYSPDNVRPLPGRRPRACEGRPGVPRLLHERPDRGPSGGRRHDEGQQGRRPGSGSSFRPPRPRSTSSACPRGSSETFTEAGAVFTNSSCSACFGGNMGILAPDEVCASSSNRNFPGRMGAKEARIYLLSPGGDGRGGDPRRTHRPTGPDVGRGR